MQEKDANIKVLISRLLSVESDVEALKDKSLFIFLQKHQRSIRNTSPNICHESPFSA